MQEVVWQEGNSIEVIVWDELTEEEFKAVIHQFESLCTANPKINILLDAGGLKKADFKIYMEEYDFYKKYKEKLNKVALVSDSTFESMLTKMFNKFSDVEFKVFPNKQTDEARSWIFPSRLP